jgi:hypothetical protein
MDKYSRIYTTTSGNEPNFESLSTQDKATIREQIRDVLDQRFTFVRYNGLTRTNIPEYTKEGMYDDSVVIVD